MLCVIGVFAVGRAFIFNQGTTAKLEVIAPVEEVAIPPQPLVVPQPEPDIVTEPLLSPSGFADMAQTGLANGTKADVDYFLENGIDINIQISQWKWSAISNAVECGNLEVLQYLVFLGADVNIKTDIEWTPLHLAVHQDNIEIMRILITAGANVNARNNAGWTVLDTSYIEEDKANRAGNVKMKREMLRAAGGKRGWEL